MPRRAANLRQPMDETVIKIQGVEGTLAGPSLSSYPSYAPRRIVLILHGLGGHRDYCYQQLLARELPRSLPGIWTFRFDFRNCGNSDDTPDPRLGRRVTGSDYEDICAVVRHFVDVEGFELCSLVGHSRGFLAILVWLASMGHKYPSPPCIINCSGRYETIEYVTSTLAVPYGTQILNAGGYPLVWRRFGKYEPQWVPLDEVLEFGRCNTDELLAKIDPAIDVLTIFGERDATVPVKDAGLWANLFIKYGHRHSLVIIEDSDHNFYDYRGLRDANGKKLTHAQQVVDQIVSYLGDLHIPQPLEISRWIDVPQVDNFRDFGGYEGVLSRILYRSGSLAKLTEQGISMLKQKLHIRRVIDLRSPHEAEERPTPHLGPEIEVTLLPVSHENWSPDGLIEKYRDRGQEFGFVRAYTGMMVSGAAAFVETVQYLRDFPLEPILIHCTAGKDRTGVLCALILLLAGVSKETVARDYALTTQGLVDFRERRLAIVKRLASKSELESFRRLLSSTYESMIRVIDAIEARGGARAYFRKFGNFTDEDLDIVARNLRGTNLSGVERL